MSADAVRAAWAASQTRIAAAGRDHRKQAVWRCHAAMGAERALMLADHLAKTGGTLKGRIKHLRALWAKRHWGFKPDLLQEALAAYLWVNQIARRDREFSARRNAA